MAVEERDRGRDHVARVLARRRLFVAEDLEGAVDRALALPHEEAELLRIRGDSLVEPDDAADDASHGVVGVAADAEVFDHFEAAHERGNSLVALV